MIAVWFYAGVLNTGRVQMSSNLATSKRRGLLGGLSAVALATAAGALMVPSAAQAHTSTVDLSRSGCSYAGQSSHGYAKTWKGGGSCSGHAWLRVNWAGNVSSWSHDASKVEFYAPGNNGIVWSEHKSCETCGSKKINH